MSVEQGHEGLPRPIPLPSPEAYASGFTSDEWEGIRNLPVAGEQLRFLSRVFRCPGEDMSLTHDQAAEVTQEIAALLEEANTSVTVGMRRQTAIERHCAVQYIRGVDPEELAERLELDVPAVRRRLTGFATATHLFFHRQHPSAHTDYLRDFLKRKPRPETIPTPRVAEPLGNTALNHLTDPMPAAESELPLPVGQDTKSDKKLVEPKPQKPPVIDLAHRIFRGVEERLKDISPDQAVALLGQLLELHKASYESPKSKATAAGKAIATLERKYTAAYIKSAGFHELTDANTDELQVRKYLTAFVARIRTLHEREPVYLKERLTAFLEGREPVFPEKRRIWGRRRLVAAESAGSLAVATPEEIIVQPNSETAKKGPACAGMDFEIFFVELKDKEGVKKAKAICHGCEIRSDCLKVAFETDQRFGIWGGMDHRQRERIRKRERARAREALDTS